MAKEISKKQAVTEYLTVHPEATTAEVVAGVKKQGIEISPESVHTIKWSLKKSNWPAAKKEAKKLVAKAEAAKAAPESAAEKPAAEAAKLNKTQAVKDYLARIPKRVPRRSPPRCRLKGSTCPRTTSATSSSRWAARRNQKQKAAAPEAVAAVPPAAQDQISLSALLEAKKLIEKLAASTLPNGPSGLGAAEQVN